MKTNMLLALIVVILLTACQRTSPATAAAEGKPIEYASIAFSGFALAISMLSLLNSISTRRDAARAQAIRDSYTIFNELDRLHLQNWQLSHLFVTPGQYYEVAKQVASRKSFTIEERVELVLKERAIAFFIFDIYEHTLYQWRQASQGNDKGRARFLLEVLDFLTSKTLRNPRLLYYWLKEGEVYEAETHRHYTANVTDNAANPLIHQADHDGPFAIAGKKSIK